MQAQLPSREGQRTERLPIPGRLCARQVPGPVRRDGLLSTHPLLQQMAAFTEDLLCARPWSDRKMLSRERGRRGPCSHRTCVLGGDTDGHFEVAGRTGSPGRRRPVLVAGAAPRRWRREGLFEGVTCGLRAEPAAGQLCQDLWEGRSRSREGQVQRSSGEEGRGPLWSGSGGSGERPAVSLSSGFRQVERCGTFFLQQNNEMTAP